MAERLISPRLTDIIEAIERIRAILSSATLGAFEDSWEKRWLVERGAEIISEASRHLPDELKNRNPEILWRKVAGVGNVIRHNYERIAADVLWKLALEDLPVLERVCRTELIAAVAAEQGGERPTPVRSPARPGS